MYEDSIRKLAKSLRNDGKTYKEIGDILKISLFSARKLCTYIPKITHKRGPKNKINKKIQLQIKRRVALLNEEDKKVDSPKIIKELNLNVSKSTVQRYFRRSDLIYKRARSQIILSQKHKDERTRIIIQWINENHDWERTIFTDEKRFSLDGPDDWRSYVSKSSPLIRGKRQCKGGGIMLWLMCMPNGLLSYRVIEGTFKSVDYIHLLKHMVVPIIHLNYGNRFYLQEDNSQVHKSRQVKDFMNISKIKVIQWPSKSPDINIVEDIWSLLSNRVYDGPQFLSRKDLIEKIKFCIDDINKNYRHLIINLYANYRRRILSVLLKKGNLFNK